MICLCDRWAEAVWWCSYLLFDVFPWPKSYWKFRSCRWYFWIVDTMFETLYYRFSSAMYAGYVEGLPRNLQTNVLSLVNSYIHYILVLSGTVYVWYNLEMDYPETQIRSRILRAIFRPLVAAWRDCNIYIYIYIYIYIHIDVYIYIYIK